MAYKAKRWRIPGFTCEHLGTTGSFAVDIPCAGTGGDASLGRTSFWGQGACHDS
jgi:hypothetical protein